MQRIDENTYIDDTLVTCAEYQLFIDEMREQGKFYQPDHWGTYQFPQRQAHEPILGCRPAYAVAFCEWLIRRDTSEWRYRLPTIEEVGHYRLVPNSATRSVGYWIMSAGTKYGFVWIDGVPADSRNITLTIREFISRALAYTHQNTFASARNIAGPFELNSKLELELVHALQRTGALDIDLTLHRAHSLDIARALDLNHSLEVDIMRALEINRTHELDLVSAFNRAIAYTIDLLRKEEIGNAIVFDIFIDVFTLKERLAGRSPAFEGIRLVKERIK
jgi:hypothetical protein